MAAKKKRKGRSVQELLGIKTFTTYGLKTSKGELLFYQVVPTNISVLSSVNIEIKIRHLMQVLNTLNNFLEYQNNLTWVTVDEDGGIVFNCTPLDIAELMYFSKE